MTGGFPAARFIPALDTLYPKCVNYGLHSDYKSYALLMLVYRVPYLLHFSMVKEDKAYELRMRF